MKVAFDVQGTLIGSSRSARIVALFKYLESQGHEMFVWSYGGRGMAQEACDLHKLKAKCMDKVPGCRYDDIDGFTMDVCVDDVKDPGLSAARSVWVNDVPLEGEFEEFVKRFGL